MLICKNNGIKINCNIYLTMEILTENSNSLPWHPVISFSVINYVVSVRRPRESGEVSFFLFIPSP